MQETAASLLHTSNVWHHEWAGKLAELLVTLTQREGGLGFAPGTSPSGGAKVFFANSGTEANEGALKIARMAGKVQWAAGRGVALDLTSSSSTSASECDKTEIVCFEHAFHGRTLGALSVTPNAKYQAPFAPLVPGVRVGRLNADAGRIGELVNARTCAVIVEPVQGEGGIHAADVEWLRALRRRCDEVGAVLIYDEIQVSVSLAFCLRASPSFECDVRKVEFISEFDLRASCPKRSVGRMTWNS